MHKPNYFSPVMKTLAAFKLWNQMQVFVWHQFSTGAIDAKLEGIRREKLEFWSDCTIYARQLQGCVGNKSLAEGKGVHAQLLKGGFEQNIFLGNTLVNMYAKCGSVLEARQVFDKMSERNIVSWNSMIAGHVHDGHGEEALGLFWQLQAEGVLKTDQFTFTSVLGACGGLGSLEDGKQTHAGIIKSGFEANDFVRSAIVDMYAKCADIVDARKVFDIMPERDVVLWNTMIAGYGCSGSGEDALKVFHQMQGVGMQANQFGLASSVKACCCEMVLEQGKQIHVHVIKRGFQSDAYVGAALVEMYSKCGSTEDARHVFDRMPVGDLFSWNAMSVGYVLRGRGKEALQLFQDMQKAGVKANPFIFASVLSACGSEAALEQGQRVHAHVIKIGFESDISAGTSLVSMYAKCGIVEDARSVFDGMPKKDVVSWNALIAGYAQQGHGKVALQLFHQMQDANIEVNQITLVSVLNACIGPEDLEQGHKIHSRIIKTGFESCFFVGSALVDMYAKCGYTEDARHVFESMPYRDVVAWTGMIAGYAQNGNPEEALKLFLQLQQGGIKLDHIILVSVLIACANLTIMEQAKQVHAHAIKSDLKSNASVGSALVDMYAKCGSVENACKMFNEMSRRSIGSWNAMLAGYAQCGLCGDSLKLFSHMRLEYVEPDQFTFASVLRACASVSDLSHGKQVHCHIIKTSFESDAFVGNALLDMYAKCASIDDAHNVFDKMPERNLVLCNAMIAAYAQHEHAEEALKLFCQVQREGMDSDQFSFASVLRGCASLAALEQGKQIHAQIIKNKFSSDVFVGSALVDMYAKCGSIEDANSTFNKMPEKDVVSWNAMIAGYAQHGQGMEALHLFEEMQWAGMKPNDITFISVLSSCSHVGLVDKGLYYFDSMSRDHGIPPRVEHYSCIVDLLGRAGHLGEAKSSINKMPFEPDAAVWRSLLAACRTHGNMDLGKYAGEYLIKLEPQHSATYVLLSMMYAEAGRWDDVARVRKLMKDRRVRKEPGLSWIEVNNQVHAFIVEDRSHPQTEQIYSKLYDLTMQIKETGYVPNTNIVLNNV